MNYRKLGDYNSVGSDLSYTYQLLESLQEDATTIQNEYEIQEEEQQQLETMKDKIERLKNKWGKGFYDVGRKILDELLKPENVDYAFLHHQYPEHASPTYDKIEEELDAIFKLEDELANGVVARIWKEETEKQGDEFYAIVHSGGPYIVLPESQRYRKSAYTNTSYYSCSLLSDKHMDMYHTRLGIEFAYSPEAMLCASRNDCATVECRYASVRTTGKVDENYIDTGHMMGDIVATRLITPKAIERSCVERAKASYGGILGMTQEGENRDSHIINEVVLDKSKAKPKSVFLAISGADYPFEEYCYAMKMSQEYHLPIHVVNVANCRRKNNIRPYSIEQREEYIQEGKEWFANGYKEVAELIRMQGSEFWNEYVKGYQRDVIGKLDEDAADIQKQLLEKIEKEVQRHKTNDWRKEFDN